MKPKKEKNKEGAVKFVPLAFAGIFTAALVVFFAVFANPLLGRAAELGLQAIFEARSDVSGFRLSVIDFEISMAKVTIADRDKPMTNIIEMGTGIRKSIRIKLKPSAVLRGKIYIEEIRADNIQLGTARKYSGSLPGKPPKVKQEKPKSDAPPLIDLKNFDARALLEQEFDKLSSPKIYDAAITAYNETYEKWKNQADSARAKANELRAAAQPLINLNAGNIRDLDTVRSTVQDINAMVSAVQSAADEAQNLVNGIETDVNTARALEQNAHGALTNDINLLKSYIDLGSGSAFATLEPFIRDALSDTAEEYLDYGLRALEILELLKEKAAVSASQPKTEKPAKVKKIAFKGRDVIFPLKSYPTFYLGTLASDVTHGSWKGAFDLSNISSNPDITGGPVQLKVDVSELSGGLRRYAGFDGRAYFTTDRSEKFTAAVKGGGFPLSLGDRLSKAGINGFAGETNFSVNLSGYPNGGVSGGGKVSIEQARIIDPKGTLAEAAATAVSRAGLVDLGFLYVHLVDEKDEFKIDTNIARLLADALKAAVQDYAQKAMAEIEKVLREKINQYIDGRFVNKEQVDALLAMARGDKAAVDQLKASLTNKVNELEKRIKDEAAKQGEQALRDALQGQTPSLQSPSLPSLPNNPFRR